ncbi:MAG TPA: phosphatase PAP2 family protein [Methylomirabilota bacterium]|nr:phosphatase PAP2 family protein [Methylomirabilota bacterium]
MPAAPVRALTPAQRRRLLVLALLCAAVFAAAAATVSAHGLFGVELSVQQRVQASRGPKLERLMRTATLLGSGGVLVAVSAAACVALWRRRRPLALAVATIAVSGYAAADLAKLITIRQRPNTVMYAFPSSHTFGIVIFLGVLAYLLWALEAPPAARRVAVAIAAAVVVAVGYSRIYLNAHWLGDVVGGLAGGGAFVVVAVLLTDRRLRAG